MANWTTVLVKVGNKNLHHSEPEKREWELSRLLANHHLRNPSGRHMQAPQKGEQEYRTTRKRVVMDAGSRMQKWVEWELAVQEL